MKIRLVAIRFGVDFRKSELTNYEIHRRSLPPLGSQEAFLFVSRSENQLVWILNFGDTTTANGKLAEIIDSRRWRLTRGTWNPDMLYDYAEEIGIELINKKSFREKFEERYG